METKSYRMNKNYILPMIETRDKNVIIHWENKYYYLITWFDIWISVVKAAASNKVKLEQWHWPVSQCKHVIGFWLRHFFIRKYENLRLIFGDSRNVVNVVGRRR
jgi:hypothetical protein